jgi:hypothetical protein
MVLDAPNQLWVADITYIAIAVGFVYLAAILDAWSRRVAGYAIPSGCVHHSDRGGQGGFNRLSQHFGGGSCDDDWSSTIESVLTRRVAVAWPAHCGAA